MTYEDFRSSAHGERLDRDSDACGFRVAAVALVLAINAKVDFPISPIMDKRRAL